MVDKLGWGILGIGGIAEQFARALPHSHSGQLVAVGSRSTDRAQTFARRHGVPHAHGSYEALLADKQVNAVYIATPHPQHSLWVFRAAEARKHILCEKPLAINHAHAMAMIEAAREYDVFLMEAFMYRCHPQTSKMIELIREGAIGEVRMMDVAHGFCSEFDPHHRLYANDLAGGAILDIGCYPVSLARLVAGVHLGKTLDPVEVSGAAHIGETGVDHWSAATLIFPNDVIAHCSASITFRKDHTARIYGTEGHLHVTLPWFSGVFEGGTSTIRLHSCDGATKEINFDTGFVFANEADTVAAHIDQRQAPWPAMSWDDTLGNMRILDRWRSAIGLVYEQEKPEHAAYTVHRRPLTVRPHCPMKYGRVAGLDKPISRLVIGAAAPGIMPDAAVMFDDFFERGGNAFDTAYIYGGGQAEAWLGHWHQHRGIRDQIVIIGKGAHTPHCDPESVTRQLFESLDRLQTDHVDIYFLHRDNPEIPVGDFVDVLNEHHRAGRVKVFGGSNWTIDRMVKANAYASKHCLEGFTVLSNNFSLARLVNPIWNGVLSASGSEWGEWLTDNQIVLFPWSSQAHGFFTDCAGPDKHDDDPMVRGFYCDDNFERRRRTIQLAKDKSVEPVNIALAFVLGQAFTTFPLVGPQLISETRSCMRALMVQLTGAEMKWLNLAD